MLPEFDLTLPPSSRGQLTTVEGLLRDIARDLEGDQPLRRVQDPEGSEKIQALVDKLRMVVPDEDEEGDVQAAASNAASKEADHDFPPFTVKLDDPAGNSFVEFLGSMADPKWNMRTYRRTLEHHLELGLVTPDQIADNMQTANTQLSPDEVLASAPHSGGAEGENEEIYVFPGVCSSCGHPLNTLMKKVAVPYFKVCGTSQACSIA
jgi:zinc finger protein